MLIDRAAGLIWLTLLVLICLPWSLELIQNPVRRTALILIGVGGIGGVAAMLFVARFGQE